MGVVQAIKVLQHLNKLKSAWNKALWRKSKMGWKAIAGAVIVAISGALYFLDSVGLVEGGAEIANGVLALGGALGIVGVRHAIAKMGKSKGE